MSGGNSSNENSGWVKIAVALIAATATISVGYWQFAQKDGGTIPIVVEPDPKPFVGKVIDNNKETGIGNAKITLEVEDSPPVTDNTDSNGVFIFSLKDSNSLVRIQVEADGYEEFDQLITPFVKVGVEEIKLVPKVQPSHNSSKSSPTSPRQGDIDYSNLRRLLADRKFKEADEETNKILLQLTGNDSYNSISDATQIGCDVYENIDSLWSEYSKDKAGNSKFGFSAQIHIFEEAKGASKFGNLVGWRENGSWLKYTDLNKTLEEAPEGYFPSRYRGPKSSHSYLTSAWMVWPFLPLRNRTTTHCFN